MIKAFRTDAHPPGERTEYWVEAVRQAATRFEIRPRDDTALCGSLWAASVGEIHVGHVDAGPQRMARTRTIISDESDAPLLLSLQEAGSSVVAQGGRETLLTSGYLAVFDARRPFLRDFPGRFRQNVAAVPFQILDVPGSYLAALIGQVYPPTHYIGGILSSFVSRLAAAAESGDCLPGAERHLQWGLTDVLIALAAHKGRLHRDVTPTAAETQRLLVRDYITAHLHRRDLSPATIAAAQRMSVRYLHKLFQDEDMSVSRWINHKRLEACREDLARPAAAGSTVGEIARRWGFVSPAHFSRSFRAAYGLSPGEWRRTASDRPPERA
ncbi:helix-turn-helix domain-containing protein [Actinacidiphila glaucinigra]|uniref:helix-turn-helix domain-containing protein n=1 Tax=Actinacidiphila glaucinigra TaxID=235986 RepID=UPI0036CA1D36